METTAQAFSNPYETSNPLSYEDWVAQVYPHEGYTDDGAQFVVGDNLLATIGNIFSGERTKAKRAYENYVTAINKANEQKALANARAYNEWYDSTKYQRLVADLKKAGLNPWLALNGGFGTEAASSVSPSSAKGVEFATADEKGSLSVLLSALAKLIAG